MLRATSHDRAADRMPTATIKPVASIWIRPVSSMIATTLEFMRATAVATIGSRLFCRFSLALSKDSIIGLPAAGPPST